MRIARLATWVAAGTLGALSAFSGCSLGNVSQDDCSEDDECRSLFGLGSVCQEGYCSDAVKCSRNFDCTAAIGNGAVCSGGKCEAADKEERCVRSEPPELIDELPGTLGDRIVFGAMFKLGRPKEDARAIAVEMAVSQINQANGIQGRPLGVIVCDNDSDGSSDNDADETTELVDYLAGQLGVAAIIGPSSSANATVATAAITNGGYDTAIISPSATGVQLTNVFDRLDPEDPFGLFWRTCPSDAFQGKRLASLIASLDMVTNVAIIFQQDQYGTGLRDSFRTEYEKDAAKTVSAHGFSVDNAASLEANIAQAVDDAEQANPHALLVISGDATRTLFVLSRVSVSPTLDLLPVFLTDGSKDAEALLSSGDADINEILSMRTQGTAAANPQSGNFVDDFNAFAPQKRDKDYRATDFSFVAHAYDAAYIAAYGAAYASRSGKAITGRMVAEGMSMLSSGGSINVGETEFPEAVNALRQEGVSVDIEGASGPLDFDASVGEAPGPIEVWSVNNTFDGFNVDDNPQIP